MWKLFHLVLSNSLFCFAKSTVLDIEVMNVDHVDLVLSATCFKVTIITFPCNIIHHPILFSCIFFLVLIRKMTFYLSSVFSFKLTNIANVSSSKMFVQMQEEEDLGVNGLVTY